jgi:hypothetical protein
MRARLVLLMLVAMVCLMSPIGALAASRPAENGGVETAHAAWTCDSGLDGASADAHDGQPFTGARAAAGLLGSRSGDSRGRSFDPRPGATFLGSSNPGVLDRRPGDFTSTRPAFAPGTPQQRGVCLQI